MWRAHDASALKINNSIDAKATRHRHGIDLLHVWNSALHAYLCIEIEFSLVSVERADRVCVVPARSFFPQLLHS